MMINQHNQTNFTTSRGTRITKPIAHLVESEFTNDEVITANSYFAKEYNEIHRFKGTQPDIDYLNNAYAPNIESIIHEAEKQIQGVFEPLLPATGDFDDPVIVSVKANFTVTLKYFKAPYEETPELTQYPVTIQNISNETETQEG